MGKEQQKNSKKEWIKILTQHYIQKEHQNNKNKIYIYINKKYIYKKNNFKKFKYIH